MMVTERPHAPPNNRQPNQQGKTRGAWFRNGARFRAGATARVTVVLPPDIVIQQGDFSVGISVGAGSGGHDSFAERIAPFRVIGCVDFVVQVVVAGQDIGFRDGQIDDDPRGVVGVVYFLNAVVRIGNHFQPVLAARQIGHVDPLIGKIPAVDIGPADRHAQYRIVYVVVKGIVWGARQGCIPGAVDKSHACLVVG
jgi:hypothetical protein